MAEEGIAAGGVMDVSTDLQEVLKTRGHEGLPWKICQVAKAWDQCQAHMCVFASIQLQWDCVCQVGGDPLRWHQISLIKVDDKKLGERAGLWRTDREGKSHKLAGRSCVIVKDHSKES